jgi:4-amino-4-deoxychorismate lyase
MTLPTTVLINGNATAVISVQDRGLLYGDGVFETLAVINGCIPLWPHHLQRLITGCRRLKIPEPDAAILHAEATQLMRGLSRAILKIIITRGTGVRGYALPEPSNPTRILQLSAWPTESIALWRSGVRVRHCQTQLAHQSHLAGIKHLNRLEQVLARAEWTDPAITEGILCDHAGNVIEAVAHNLFLVKAGTLYTAELNLCGVAGVMRKIVLELAASLGINAVITNISLAMLHQAEEVFLSNSIHGLWPIRQIDHDIYPVGPITRQLSEQIQQLLPL